MPDPLVYLQALIVAAVAGLITVLAFRHVLSPAIADRENIASLFAIGCGGVAGCCAMGASFSWPPVSGLDRFFTIVLPAALCVELAATIRRIPRVLVAAVRLALIVLAGRILLHGSTYLHSPDNSLATGGQTVIALFVVALVLALVWGLMVLLAKRSPDASLPLAIALATLCAGILVMLAGYLKGGGAAFPLAGALAGTSIAFGRNGRGDDLRGVIGIGVVCLFGIVFIGRFFGRLTTTSALVVFVTPLLCWVSELPAVHSRKRWQIALVRLLLVAGSLGALLTIGKQKFEREMRPLMSHSQTMPMTGCLTQFNFRTFC